MEVLDRVRTLPDSLETGAPATWVLLSQAEGCGTDYFVTEQEFFGVIYGITTSHRYLIGEYLDLHNDRTSLRWLLDISDPSGRLMRWRIRLCEFTFVIHHEKAYINAQADTLSRFPSTGRTTVKEDYEIPCYILPVGVSKELLTRVSARMRTSTGDCETVERKSDPAIMFIFVSKRKVRLKTRHANWHRRHTEHSELLSAVRKPW